MDTIRPSVQNENPQRSPYRDPNTLQRNDGLRNSSPTTGSSSSLDTIGLLSNHENLQLRSYPCSTAAQSNGSVHDPSASVMTSPKYDSSIEGPNDFGMHSEDSFGFGARDGAEVCLPRHDRLL